jgi:ABC-type nitrate/sulfonate/bicarbonate transport systems, periplasmic components
MSKIPAIFLFLTLSLAGAAHGQRPEKTVTIGYFTTLTHAQALIAQNMSATGEDWFERYLPKNIHLAWQNFNAGPAAMNSLLGGMVDLSYAGPNPTLDAFIRSQGGVVVVAGAIRGGSALLVPRESLLATPADFRGRRIATPQMGNSQDIACRHWLIQGGLKITPTGGEADIIPVPSFNLSSLFDKGAVDGAWTVEPWIARLELETGARVIYSEPTRECLTTILVARESFTRIEPEIAAALTRGHRELTEWIKANPEEAKQRLVAELTRQTRHQFPPEAVERAWPRLWFDNGIDESEFERYAEAAREAGFLRAAPDLRGLVREVAAP